VSEYQLKNRKENFNLLKKLLQTILSPLLNVGYRENGTIKDYILVKVQYIEMLCRFLAAIM